jgi:hypothetical protein
VIDIRDRREQFPYVTEQGNKSGEQRDKLGDQGIKSLEQGKLSAGVDDDDVGIPISGRFPGISARIPRISDTFDRARDASGLEFSALRGIERGNDGDQRGESGRAALRLDFYAVN